jgi:hypothetical protein
MTGQSDEIHVLRRFRGPPTSGNGGYVCGLAAEWIEGQVKTQLKFIVLDDNHIMIYKELSPYKSDRLATPCDGKL